MVYRPRFSLTESMLSLKFRSPKWPLRASSEVQRPSSKFPLEADESESDGVVIYWGRDGSIDRIDGLTIYGSRMGHGAWRLWDKRAL